MNKRFSSLNKEFREINTFPHISGNAWDARARARAHVPYAPPIPQNHEQPKEFREINTFPHISGNARDARARARSQTKVLLAIHDLFNCLLLGFCFIQARSERGSRRLPHERSSEISKNCHKNYLCKFPNIHPRENKSGRQIWAFFVGFSYAL